MKKPSYAKASEGGGGPSWDQDRPLRNHAVRDFREGPDCRGGSIPARKAKRQSDDCLARGPSWDRTSDPLIMSVKIAFPQVYTDLYLLVPVNFVKE
jgi:hypothetical protein